MPATTTDIMRTAVRTRNETMLTVGEILDPRVRTPEESRVPSTSLWRAVSNGRNDVEEIPEKRISHYPSPRSARIL